MFDFVLVLSLLDGVGVIENIMLFMSDVVFVFVMDCVDLCIFVCWEGDICYI